MKLMKKIINNYEARDERKVSFGIHNQLKNTVIIVT